MTGFPSSSTPDMWIGRMPSSTAQILTVSEGFLQCTAAKQDAFQWAAECRHSSRYRLSAPTSQRSDSGGRLAVPIPIPKLGQERELMTYALLNVSVPFVIEFVRRKCRKFESGIFWEDGTVAIRTVPAEQAPVACRVRPGENAFRPEFSVRSFEGRLWWPLFDGPRHMPVGNYMASATKSEGPFLSMMNLSPATVYSKRRYAKQFFEQIFARRV